MDRLIEEMVALAGSHQAHRLCLFGSRARGDHRLDSDYDFALLGIPADRQPLFLNDVEELPSLCKIDVVFVDQQTDPAFLSNIQADGVILMDKFDTKLENFHRALLRLQEGLAGYDEAQDKQLARDGIIQRFEFTCELAWKTVREWLLDQGHVELNSPKSVMRQAFADGLVSDNDGWISLLNDRNRTSHIYDENTAEQIFQRIRQQYASLFEELFSKMSQ